MFYYWAVNIKNINFWLVETDKQPTWLKMEKEDCSPFEISSILFANIKISKKTYSENLIIDSGIRIWKQIKKTLKLECIPLALTIVNNITFKPSMMDKGFLQWKNYGINKMGDLYRENVFLSFQELQQIYGLHSKDYFRYLQIREITKKQTHRKSEIERQKI